MKEPFDIYHPDHTYHTYTNLEAARVLMYIDEGNPGFSLLVDKADKAGLIHQGMTAGEIAIILLRFAAEEIREISASTATRHIPKQIDREYVEVKYLNYNGGAGLTRLHLDRLPAYIEDNPGTMVTALRHI